MRCVPLIAFAFAPALAAQTAAPRPHWAFVAPTRPPLPGVQRADWPKNPIDRFVLARLEQQGLQPSPPADRATLLRRLCLDLTGLPPTLEELDAFGADTAPDAQGRVLDRLFSSPRHAEHLARQWLDVARFGDTHGMESDNERTLWPWRDEVIAAFAQNQPFDQFTIEQLAGDLLPDATQGQRIASGFHRNGVSTAEGGLIPEELLARYASERVEVTATVWLGLTLGCARCHDHKYDPITQRDFYALFDFFHSIAEQGSNENAPAPPPNLRVFDPEQQRLLDDAEQKLAELRAARAEFDPTLAAAFADWERTTSARLAQQWRPCTVLAARAQSGAVLTPRPDGSVLASGALADQDVYDLDCTLPRGPLGALRLEALRATDEQGKELGPGRADNGNCVLTGIELNAAPPGTAGAPVPVGLFDASADFSQRGFPPAHAIDRDARTGWAFAGSAQDHVFVCRCAAELPGDRPLRLAVRLRFESPHAHHSLLRFRLAAGAALAAPAVALQPWRQCGPLPKVSTEILDALAEPDPPPDAGFVPRPTLADDVPQSLPAWKGTVLLERTIAADGECDAVLALGSNDGLGVWLDGERLFTRGAARSALPDQELVAVHLRAGDNRLRLALVDAGGAHGFFCRLCGTAPDGVPPMVAAVLALPAAQRSDADRAQLGDHWRRHHDRTFRERSTAIAAIERQQAEIRARVPATMVMQERAERRPSFVLQRGRYDLPGAAVAADVPAFLPPLPAGAPHDRLALARWLVQRGQPLTARVTVNRLWQQLFGGGLVDTPHDFGTKGSRPSHPELLDWLACEFMDSGWDLRHVLRLCVTSATYAQDPAATATALARDPDNRWLSRSSRCRLDAEVIRDQALAIAGLLVERTGGPSVKPYQPPGVWEPVAFPGSNTAAYVQDHGDALHRRSLYTFWKRTAPPPLLALLDAPSRETCAVRRERTDTPLQALALWNDTGLHEAARAFAARLLHEPGDDATRLLRGHRCCTAQAPDADEQATLRALLDRARADWAQDRDAAARFVHVGEAPVPADLDVTELAAYTVVAGVLLNLDATLTRN